MTNKFNENSALAAIFALFSSAQPAAPETEAQAEAWAHALAHALAQAEVPADADTDTDTDTKVCTCWLAQNPETEEYELVVPFGFYAAAEEEHNTTVEHLQMQLLDYQIAHSMAKETLCSFAEVIAHFKLENAELKRQLK